MYHVQNFKLYNLNNITSPKSRVDPRFSLNHHDIQCKCHHLNEQDGERDEMHVDGYKEISLKPFLFLLLDSWIHAVTILPVDLLVLVSLAFD